MPILVTNLSRRIIEIETAPSVQQNHEHYNYYLQLFIAKCRHNGVAIRNFSYSDLILHIFVQDDRGNWTDLVEISLYDQDGNILPEIAGKYSY